MALINMVYNFITSFGRLMTDACMVERLKSYCDFKIFEGPFTKQKDSEIDSNWPVKGEVEIKGLDLRYREGLPLVIKKLDLRIAAGQKVAILGRTGNGKSTLMLSLMRILEPAAGSIIIDDVDIHKIGLNRLRKSISIIPQDPYLMEGTLRFNLDQHSLYKDTQILEVIKKLNFCSTLQRSTPTTSKTSKNTAKNPQDTTEIQQTVQPTQPTLAEQTQKKTFPTVIEVYSRGQKCSIKASWTSKSRGMGLI